MILIIGLKQGLSYYNWEEMDISITPLVTIEYDKIRLLIPA